MVIENVCTGPVQVLDTADTLIKAVIGAVVTFTPANAAILPEPDAAKPMEGVLLVQLNVAFNTVPVKLMAVDNAVLQTACGVTDATIGVGFTVYVKVVEAPEQVLETGVTTIWAVKGTFPALFTANELMVPEPEGANPIEGVLLVQLNTVFNVKPVKLTVVVVNPLQIT